MEPTHDPRIAVIGVGNPYRSDDGVGHVVAGRLRDEVMAAAGRVGRPSRLHHLDVSVSDGEATRLIDAWAGVDLAVIIDAVSSGGEPGKVRLIEAGVDELPSRALTSSHSSGIAEAWALAGALATRPARLVIIGIEVASTEDGTELSPPVRDAVTCALRLVHAALASAPQPVTIVRHPSIPSSIDLTESSTDDAIQPGAPA